MKKNYGVLIFISILGLICSTAYKVNTSNSKIEEFKVEEKEKTSDQDILNSLQTMSQKEFEQIIQRMIDAGESESAIKSVIEEYNRQKAKVRNNDIVYKQPQNGFSPYDNYFGKGIYNNSTGNEFVIKNSDGSDAVVLLVNYNTGRKTRNEYIRSGQTFKMTGVPNGTYYLEWTTGLNWDPNLNLGAVKGGFSKNPSYSKSNEYKDLMKVSGYERYTVTLYSVAGGNMETENISSYQFGR